MIRQFSAGGIVFKREDNQMFYLLRRSTLNPGHYEPGAWSLPKGWLDDAGDGVSPGPLTLGQKRATEDQIQTAAMREVREETGVEAKIITRVGINKFFFIDQNHQKVFKTVIYYLMEFLRSNSSGFDTETSEIAWMTLDQARDILKKRRGEGDLVTDAHEIIQKSH